MGIDLAGRVMERVEVSLSICEYWRCVKAAEQAGMELEEWLRDAVEHYLADCGDLDGV